MSCREIGRGRCFTYNRSIEVFLFQRISASKNPSRTRPFYFRTKVLDFPDASRPLERDDFFQVPAFLDQIPNRIACGNSDDVLLDDGPIVKHFRYVARGGAQQLYAALKRLEVRPHRKRAGKNDGCL